MAESISIRSDDDPDSRALKTGLGIIFWPKPTLIVLGWLGVLFLGWPSKLVIFASLIWLGAHLMFRPSKFGAEIGQAIDAGLQFLGACNAFMARHIEPILAKMNAAHHVKRRAREAAPTAPTPQALLSENRRAFAAAARSAEASDAAAAEPIIPPAPAPRAPRPPVDWLAVLRRWWWIAPVALLAIVAARFVGWATDFINGPSAREVVADVRANEAEAQTRTADAENEQLASALRRVEEAAARLSQMEREAENARDAIRNAPTLDAGIAEHDAYVDGLRDQSARDRAAAVSDLRSTIDP